MATRHETDRYRLETQGNGLFATLTRKGDGASTCFQGDDSAHVLATLEGLESTWLENTAKLDEMFNYMCSQYDGVLQLVGEG